MESDPSIPQGLGWVLWYASEVAFKWVPGFVVSMAGVGDQSVTGAGTSPPIITEPVRVQDVVLFLQTSSAPGVYDQLYGWWGILVGLSIAISLLLSAIIIYCVTRVFQIRQAEYRKFNAMAHTVAAGDIPKTKLRWNRILEQANSDSDQARRLAILEADIMLGELLDELGYRGETMADKMRQVSRENFNSIDLAWEAHRARNKVAHEADPNLTAHDVQRVIGIYNRIFREFGFIEG